MPLRVSLIAIFVVAGLALVIGGWKMTGQLAGLGIQLVDHCVVVNDRYCSICQRLNIGYLRK